MATAIEKSIGQRGPSAKSDDWFSIRYFDANRDRRVVFGASTAAAAVGISKYKSALDVYCEQRRIIEPAEPSAAMLWGNRHEPTVLQAYEDHLNERLPKLKFQLMRNLPMFFHDTVSYMACTPDGIVKVEGTEYGVEVKTTTSRMLDESGEDPAKFGPDGSDRVPMDYVVQVQHQMAVMGWDFVEMPVLFKDTDDFRIYKVDRSEKLISQIIEAEGQLAEKIIDGIEPDADYGHKNTRMLLAEIYGAVIDEVADLADLEEAIEYRKQLAADKSEMEKEIKTLDNTILDAMETAKYGKAGEHKVTRVKISESKWTDKDIETAKEKLGQTKRRGSVSLRFSFFAEE